MAALELVPMWTKRVLSKRLWRYYLRSAERLLKVFRIISISFLISATSVVILLLSLLTPLFSQAALYVLAHLPLPPLPDTAPNTAPTAYVVLGGGLTNDNNNRIVLNAYSLNRVRTVATAYHDLPLPIVLSGAEAPWLGQWLIEHGINDLIAENASMNTCENARFTAKRAPLHHVYLVTDGYHMARARRQFALNGINTTALNAPLPVKRYWMEPAKNLTHSRRAVYEMAAYLRDVLRPQLNCRQAKDISIQQLLAPRGQVDKNSDSSITP